MTAYGLAESAVEQAPRAWLSFNQMAELFERDKSVTAKGKTRGRGAGRSDD